MGLKARFVRACVENTKRTCVVIIGVVSGGEVQDMGVAGRCCARGMGKVIDQFIIILNAYRLLSDDEMNMLADAY